MLFYEPLFLFFFFPIVLAAFLSVRQSVGARAWVLLAVSIVFFLWSQPLFVPIVLATCVADFRFGRMIAQNRKRRRYLVCGIIINLGVLVYYKYTNFAVDNLDILLAQAGFAPLHFGRVALPIGVSFIVFEKISYLVDIARNRSQPAPHFHTYLLYVFLFPKLLAGPIVKYHELEAQLLASGRQKSGDLVLGFSRFMQGVVKKTVLADTLGSAADMSFNADPVTLGCADAWWGVLFFAFQIYFDFSAYSDMAIGLARMLGFYLNENFNMPYISCSITEFWQRWHISLTSWIREYLYIPLGGNRVPAWRCYMNLWICFLASGLWHDAAWHYVVWGGYNGVLLVLERMFLLRFLGLLPRIAANIFTFLVTLIGWTIFRASSLRQASLFFCAMLHPGKVAQSFGIWRTPLMMTVLTTAALISFLPRLPGYATIADRVMISSTGRFVTNSGLAMLFVFALAKALADPFKPFLYFRF